MATASACHIRCSANEVRWGSLCVNSGKALVNIVEISYSNVKLPCSNGTFNRNTTSLRDYLANNGNKFIVAHASSIYKLVSNIHTLKHCKNEKSNSFSIGNQEYDFSEHDRKLTPKEMAEL